MPGPLDLLKRGFNFATTPMVDEETIAPYQDALDSPTLDRSPMEAQLRGFGAGAMEGLRGLTSPLNMAGMATMGGGAAAMRGLGQAGNAVQKMARPTMDLIDTPGVGQVAPAMDDVTSLIGDMQRNLAKIPGRR